jgi:phosphatidate cytidylyltransferase
MINNLALGAVLMILGTFSLLEFFNISLKIFKKKRLKQLLSNLIFTIYIFSFCSYFFALSFFLHLKIILFVILITCVASDIGGFVFGKIFKGPKLTKISPKKTYSGMIGSYIISFIATYFLFKNYLIFTDLIIFILIISTSSQIGDLLISYLKRNANIKDTGNILPGHGGLLDRFDGLILAIPIGLILSKFYDF